MVRLRRVNINEDGGSSDDMVERMLSELSVKWC